MERRVLGSGRWDPYHYHHGQIAPRPELVLSLTLSCLGLTDSDVSHLPNSLQNLHTLSFVFNLITDAGLAALLKVAPKVVVLDLEANDMVFNISSPVVNSLWCVNSSLPHLNVSHNSQTIESLTYLCQRAGLSRLLTLDAAMSRSPAMKVLACLIPYLLENRRLERVDLHGIRFCTLAQRGEIAPEPELSPDCPIGRAISVHPRLRSILFDKSLFHPHHQGSTPSTDVSIWTHILYHVLMGDG